MIQAIFVLYTRLDAEQVLGSDLRRAILDDVRRQPGIRLGELARALGVDPKTVAHHVRVLTRARRMEVVDEGRARMCFAPGTARVRAPPPRAILAMRAVLAGASTPAELARALEIPRGTAGGLLRAMAQRGLAVRAGAGWALSPEAAAMLADADERLCRRPFIGAS